MSLPGPERVSVTELARRHGRSGDLGSRHFSLLRGVDGIRTHQRLQRGRGKSFQAEVSLSTLIEHAGLEVFGRVDGVESTPEGPVLEEIKTVRDPSGPTESDKGVYQLQTRLYAWMWWRNYGVCPRLRLRWASPEVGGFEGEERWEETPEVLDQDMLAVLEKEAVWRQARREWLAERQRQLSEVTFPFEEMRPGQADLMQAVEDVMRSGGRLDVQAPTGIGKTMAVLLPSLRALGRGQVNTLMVATHRNAGKNVVEDALRHLAAAGMRLKALTLVARDRVCRQTGVPCDCSACPLALGFYDRLEAGLADLRKEPLWDGETWQRIAVAHQVCPFAFMMSAAREADVLIGDINYALDPSARLEFLFGNDSGSVGLLVDEAHQLPDRARGMLSAALDMDALSKRLRMLSPELRTVVGPGLRSLQTEVRRWQKEFLDKEGRPLDEREVPESIARKAWGAAEALEASLADVPVDGEDTRFELIRMLRGYAQSVDGRLPSHVTYKEGRTVHHFCRDPAPWLREKLGEVGSVVLFSATLAPMEVFGRLTGREEGHHELVLRSPFAKEALQVEVETGIPLVWKSRTASMYDALTARIQRYLAEAPGKALVFFPSYAVMQEVAERMPAHDLWTGPVQIQPRGLQEAEAERFLAPFRGRPGPITGLAVLGGALNEGVDLPGDALTSVVVVSIGLPGLSPEREWLRAWFQAEEGDGFYYAYTHPGLIRVRQAMGRVLRGPEDEGRVLLMDPRFTHPVYAGLLAGD